MPSGYVNDPCLITHILSIITRLSQMIKNIIKKQSSRRCLFYRQPLSSNKLRHAIFALPIYITYIACVVGEIKLHVFEILGHYSTESKLLFFSSESKGMILFPTNNNNRYIHLT